MRSPQLNLAEPTLLLFPTEVKASDNQVTREARRVVHDLNHELQSDQEEPTSVLAVFLPETKTHHYLWGEEQVVDSLLRSR